MEITLTARACAIHIAQIQCECAFIERAATNTFASKHIQQIRRHTYQYQSKWRASDDIHYNPWVNERDKSLNGSMLKSHDIPQARYHTNRSNAHKRRLQKAWEWNANVCALVYMCKLVCGYGYKAHTKPKISRIMTKCLSEKRRSECGKERRPSSVDKQELCIENPTPILVIHIESNESYLIMPLFLIHFVFGVFFFWGRKTYRVCLVFCYLIRLSSIPTSFDDFFLFFSLRFFFGLNLFFLLFSSICLYLLYYKIVKHWRQNA